MGERAHKFEIFALAPSQNTSPADDKDRTVPAPADYGAALRDHIDRYDIDRKSVV